ncbi:hypothetical protein Tco_0646326 [Tanacetum coccineum]
MSGVRSTQITSSLGASCYKRLKGSNPDSDAQMWSSVTNLNNDLGMLMHLPSPLFPSVIEGSQETVMIVQIWARSGFDRIEEFLGCLRDCQTVSRHLKLFEGFKVQLGEDPIQAQRGGLRAGGEGYVKDPHCIHLIISLLVVELVELLYEDYPTIFPRLPLTEFFCENKGIYLSCFFLHFPFSLIYDLLFLPTKMAFRNFIYTKDDEDLAFLPKEPSLGFGTGSPFVSVNMEPLKANEEPVIQPIEVIADSGGSPKPELFVVHPGSVAVQIKDRKCKTRGGSSKTPVKRKLAPESLNSRATRAKTSSSKEDAPFLTVFDDDEGLPDVLELKDATAYDLKISAITPLTCKNYLDNHINVELLDLRDRCYARQAMVDNDVNRRSCELLQVIEKLREAAMTEFKKNPAVVALREKMYVLSIKVKEHKLNLDRMMLESQKWVGYQQSPSTLESKVTYLEAEKARLEAVKVSFYKEVDELKQDRREVVSKVVPYAAMELVHSDDMGSLVGKLVSSAILYGRCRRTNPFVVALWEKIFVLSAEVKGAFILNLNWRFLVCQKWEGLPTKPFDLWRSNGYSLEAKKVRYQKFIPYAAIEIVHSDDMGRAIVVRLWSSAILYGEVLGRLRAGYDMEGAFRLVERKCYRSILQEGHTQAITMLRSLAHLD